MRYYLDCEFNGMGGELLSLALVSDGSRSLYIIRQDLPQDIEPWVANHVLPILHADRTGDKHERALIDPEGKDAP